MTEEEERRILSRRMDRLERCLIRSEEEYRAERRKRSALRRQKNAKKTRDAGDLMLPMTSLNIEAEVNHIAFLHDVVFSLES